MESFAKRHPALTTLAVALALWFVLGWWRRKHPEIPGASAGANGASAPQTTGQKVAAALDHAQSLLAKAAIIVPPLALLTPKTATDVYHNVANFFGSFEGGGFDATIKFADGSGTLPYGSFSNHDLPGIPANAQVDNKGEITFDGTASGNYIAAWRARGFEVYVDGNAITLKPDASAASHPGAPPLAPAPAAA